MDRRGGDTGSGQDLVQDTLARSPDAGKRGRLSVAPRDDGFSLEPGYFGHLIADRHPGFLRFFFPEVYRLVEETLPGVAASRIAMCGDTLHTDILELRRKAGAQFS